VTLVACDGGFRGTVDTQIIASEAVGDEFQIDVYRPDGTTPSRIFYVLDGNAHGEPLARLAQEHGVAAVVVAIGYPTGFDIERRRRDYSPTADPQWPLSGGSSQFFAFVRDELIPTVERGELDSPDERALFGHSQGGLAAWTDALNPEHRTFAAYVAASPAAWWDGGVLLDLEASHADQADALPARIYSTVGALEPITFTTYHRALTEQVEGRDYGGLDLEAETLPKMVHNPSWLATYERALEVLW
jgi:predicted alpha/beta superfamily hydrolase